MRVRARRSCDRPRRQDQRHHRPRGCRAAHSESSVLDRGRQRRADVRPAHSASARSAVRPGHRDHKIGFWIEVCGERTAPHRHGGFAGEKGVGGQHLAQRPRALQDTSALSIIQGEGSRGGGVRGIPHDAYAAECRVEVVGAQTPRRDPERTSGFRGEDIAQRGGKGAGARRHPHTLVVRAHGRHAHGPIRGQTRRFDEWGGRRRIRKKVAPVAASARGCGNNCHPNPRGLSPTRLG